MLHLELECIVEQQHVWRCVKALYICFSLLLISHRLCPCTFKSTLPERNHRHIIVGWKPLIASAAASSVVHPDVMLPVNTEPPSSDVVIALSSAGFFKWRLIEGPSPHPFLMRLHAVINLPRYHHILIKTKMIGPQPRTSHRNRKTRRGEVKSNQKQHPDSNDMRRGLSVHRM